MNFADLFPENPTVKINGQKYAVQYKGSALFCLERQFKGREVTVKTDDGPVTYILRDAMQIMHYFMNMIRTEGVSLEDAYSLLYAGLKHTGQFKDYELFIDAVNHHEVQEAMTGVWQGLSISYLTPDQIDKLRILAEKNDSSKNAVEPTQKN